jgi:hypothetical protein
MKLKRRYTLDEKNRVKDLFKDEEFYSNLPLIEWDYKTYPFMSCYYGLNNGVPYVIGHDEYVINQNKITSNIHRIKRLKKLLEETDWKVVVNSELFQSGLPLKYPNLHEERQAWRDEINQLEGELESLGSPLE